MCTTGSQVTCVDTKHQSNLRCQGTTRLSAFFLDFVIRLPALPTSKQVYQHRHQRYDEGQTMQ